MDFMQICIEPRLNIIIRGAIIILAIADKCNDIVFEMRVKKDCCPDYAKTGCFILED